MNERLFRRLFGLGGLLAALWLLLMAGLYAQSRRTAPGPTPAPARWAYVYVDGRPHRRVRTAAHSLRELLEQVGLEEVDGVWVNGRRWAEGEPLPVQGPLLVRVETRPLPTPLAGAPLAALPPAAWPGPVESPVPLRRGLWQGAEGRRELWAAASFTGEALAQHHLAPQGLDRVLPDEEAPWPPETPVRTARVREALLLEQEPIPYDSKTQPLPEVPLDTIQVVQEGAPGIKAREVLVRYEDGEEVARIPLGEWVLQPPQPRIVGYGTKIVIQTLDTPDGPIRYWRAVRVYATSYSPCRVHGAGGPCDDITASGERLRKGIIAVRLSWYRYMKGLRVYVPGYGFGIIADVGGGIPGRHWIDLGYSEEDYRPWHQWTTLYFLAPPPPPERILWVLP